MLDFVNWNLSKKGHTLKQADAFVISFPKSGRTWLRVFYFTYLSKLAGREFSWSTTDFLGYPNVVFTHDRWEHRVLPGWWNYLRGRHLVPSAARREKKIVLLARDPRDVVVSLHFHLTKRPHAFKWKPQPLSEMLRDERFGISHTVELMNRWLAEWHGQPNFKLMRYEDCKLDPPRELAGFLEFFGLAPLDPAAFEHAVNFSRFENMQSLEAAGKFTESELLPGNPADRDSFKARRAKVGGFRDVMSAADLEFTAAAMKHLDARFGYTV